MPRVNANILGWARETAGLTREDAAEKLHLSESRGVSAVDRLSALEFGEVEPTRPMLVKMAKVYRRPLLTFYMSTPPRKGNRGQDFRTLPEGHSESDDALLDALIRNICARQSMIRAVMEGEEEAITLPFIGSMTISDGVPAVLASIRETLRIKLSDFRDQRSHRDAFALLRAGAERAGVFVLLMGNLGSHHTSIDLEIFRGFALADIFAPFVVINDQDSSAAWSFTLLHELTHLWLGQTGVSGARTELAIERFCNEVAGEFLLPSEELVQLQFADTTDFNRLVVQISNFANERNISSSMVAYRLFLLGSIDQDTWRRCSAYFREHWFQERRRQREREHEKEGAPNYFIVRRHRVGKALIDLVRRMTAAGALTTSKAGRVLGVKAKHVKRLSDIHGSSSAGWLV
ncbi:ImmA/IrrE family metallo-endopeptidase [Candidatus Poribacteria bacterium]|nr:ImmA/IrrE family metallo-endopeptidase [Candidatus Poribacteria bacterium]